uniref:Uncharacterized protein n=1 Tax=Chelonoidis abingdonii TaxID=106734 RepID=A0A8C0GRY3_CHEAB
RLRPRPLPRHPPLPRTLPCPQARMLPLTPAGCAPCRMHMQTVPPPGLPAGGAALGVGPWMSLSLSGQFDGTHIVSGSLDTSIRVWDMESGNCLHTLMGHQSLTSGMELRDNILVSGNADSTVKIWDIKTGQCLQTLQGEWDRVGQGPALQRGCRPSKHQSAVTCLQFSSKFVVTSSDDGTVKLWDLKTGEFVRNLVALESGGSGGVVKLQSATARGLCPCSAIKGSLHPWGSDWQQGHFLTRVRVSDEGGEESLHPPGGQQV